jgi:hypothetical protein
MRALLFDLACEPVNEFANEAENEVENELLVALAEVSLVGAQTLTRFASVIPIQPRALSRNQVAPKLQGADTQPTPLPYHEK